MISESVIVSSIGIFRPKQVVSFQIRIPREAERILGVEIDFNLVNGVWPQVPTNPNWTLPLSAKRNVNIGILKMQSSEQANIFFTTRLQTDRNTGFANPSGNFFTPKEFSHQGQSHEDSLNISGASTIVEGVFKDRLYESIEGNYQYKVEIYTWVSA